ncbi:MAG: response regulator transcription factor, partial [Chloroflexota bacterium]
MDGPDTDPIDLPLRVVIVDAHPVLRGVIRMACGSAGDLEVVAEAEDVAGALKVCEEHHPDVVVLDLELPGEEGTGLIRALQ